MPTVSNVRLGFANNSSSSHSFIIMRGLLDDSGGSYGGYGWENFTLASPGAKDDYIAILLYHSLVAKSSPRLALAYTNTLMKTNLEIDENGWLEDDIDHQSHLRFPVQWDESDVDHEFFAEFLEWARGPEVAIIGGNDNGDYQDNYGAKSPRITSILSKESGSSPYVARKEGKFWTLFNRQNGTKFRFSFHDILSEDLPTHSMYPELVDLKITDRCPFELKCGWCYQGSTLAGKEGNFNKIIDIISDLADSKVFEVAIGGGEPTLHPEFLEIVSYCRSQHVIPNFTTQNMGWMRDEEQRVPILESIGSFAFSINDHPTMVKLVATLNRYEIPIEKVQIQIIPAILATHNCKEIMRTAAENGIGVTMLGYKTTGRGAKHKPANTDDSWVAPFSELRDKSIRPQISIDTLMATSLDMEKLGIPKWMYHTKEGKFSMYIDAVTEQMGPSSFCEPEEMLPLSKGIVHGMTTWR